MTEMAETQYAQLNLDGNACQVAQLQHRFASWTEETEFSKYPLETLKTYVTMETVEKETDVATTVELKEDGPVLEPQQPLQTYERRHVVMVLSFTLTLLTETMEIQITTMGVQIPVQFRLDGLALKATRQLLVNAMSFVETEKQCFKL